MKRSHLLLAMSAALPIVLSTTHAAPLRASFTAAQATEGAELYRGGCAMCHGPDLLGNWEIPPLTGRFVANWAGAPLSALHDYITRAMPQTAPGTLEPAETTAIIAYLLQQNCIRPRKKPLPEKSSEMRNIVFPQSAAPVCKP